MMGQLIVYRIEQRIAANPNALNGVVDFYPMLNPLGLDIAHRMDSLRYAAGYEPRFPRFSGRYAA